MKEKRIDSMQHQLVLQNHSSITKFQITNNMKFTFIITCTYTLAKPTSTSVPLQSGVLSFSVMPRIILHDIMSILCVIHM